MGKLLFLAFAAALLFWLWRRWQRQSRLDFIARSPLPRSLRPQLIAQYPDWREAQLRDVEAGLRQFFRICAQAPGQFTAMPSKAVDAAWHACILDTRAYERYCRNAFGRLLHHTPAEALPAGRAPKQLEIGLRRAWLGACRDEGLDPFKTATLPLLFSLDTQLAIAGGYHYVPDCRLLGQDRGDTHCGSALACGGGGGSSSDGGGCGGGD